MQNSHSPRMLFSPGGPWFGIALVPVLFLSGCATNTQTGALAGGAVGAGAGAAIGAAAHNPIAGALIGGVVGTAVGASAGANADENARRKAIAQDVAARGGPVSLEQVRDMTQNHVPDPEIINQIRLTRTVYTLTPDQIIWLKQQGVSDAVIQTMQYTGYGPARQVIYVDPAPPPPVVGFGFGYRRGW